MSLALKYQQAKQSMPFQEMPKVVVVKTVILLALAMLLAFPFMAQAEAVAQETLPPQQQTSQHKPLQKVVLQLKWLHQFQFAGYYAAQKEGYYRDAGLQVDIRQRDLFKNNIQQVIDGEAQYGVADSVLLLYQAKKQPIVIVAPIFQHSPQVLFTLKSSQLNSPYLLDGKKIAFYPKDTDGFPILAMMKELKISPSYDRVLMKADPSALVRKDVDAYAGYLTNEGYFYKADGDTVNVINPMNYGIDLYGDMLFTSQAEVKEHPERVEAFKQASLKGWRYAMSHKEEMARYILETYHPPHKTFQRLMHEANALDEIISEKTTPIGTLSEGRLQFIYNLFKKQGLIQNDVDLSKGIYKEQTKTLQFSDAEILWMKQHPVIRLAIDPNWEPIDFVDKKGNYSGISASFFNYLTTKTGLIFKPATHLTWPQAVEKMKHQQLDVYSAAISTELRREYARFTQPYVKFPNVVATRNDAPYVADFKQLNGKVIAVVKDYAAEEKMKQLFPKAILKQVNSAPEGLLMVSLGKAYGYVDNVAAIGHYIKAQGLTNVKISGEMPFAANIAIGVRKDWPELYSILQKTLENMPDETYAQLINPWLKVSYQKQYDWKELLVYAVPVLAVFLIVLGFNFKLRKTQQQLVLTNEQLSVQSITDHLTQIYNRQYLDQVFEMEKERMDRYQSKLSLILLDLDNFKRVNDNFGHLVGDQVLIQVTKTIAKAIRKTDVLGRWGGEEFMVICPETNLEQARVLAEKIRQQIEREHFPQEITQTLSLGVAQLHLSEKINEAVNRADNALYNAKHLGKNQVSCDGSSISNNR